MLTLALLSLGLLFLTLTMVSVAAIAQYVADISSAALSDPTTDICSHAEQLEQHGGLVGLFAACTVASGVFIHSSGTTVTAYIIIAALASFVSGRMCMRTYINHKIRQLQSL